MYLILNKVIRGLIVVIQYSASLNVSLNTGTVVWTCERHGHLVSNCLLSGTSTVIIQVKQGKCYKEKNRYRVWRSFWGQITELTIRTVFINKQHWGLALEEERALAVKRRLQGGGSEKGHSAAGVTGREAQKQRSTGGQPPRLLELGLRFSNLSVCQNRMGGFL